MPPSSVVTVIVASPAFTAVTLPLVSTVATAASLDFHVTFLLVASAGATVAESVSLAPVSNDRSLLLSVTPVTATTASLTVTLQEAVLPPSSVVTVMVASPAFTPVTLPLASTVATASLPDIHVTFLFAASAGATVAVSVSLAPMLSVRVVLLSDTPVTVTAGGVGSGSSFLLHDQKLVVNRTAVTNRAVYLSIFFFICFYILS